MSPPATLSTGPEVGSVTIRYAGNTSGSRRPATASPVPWPSGTAACLTYPPG
ncbi:hypothetical protein ACFOLD_00985 [Kocuria carniphila]|uniref:hypothetical protein n=1 Tax=Kocuria carniphila TaxID=262208 RepID=UPI003607BE59